MGSIPIARSTRILLPTLLVLAAACRGSSPISHGTPEEKLSSVLIGARILNPKGRELSGTVRVNLEGEGDGANTYRLILDSQQPRLYQIEPGRYRLGPTRGYFGSPKPTLAVTSEGADLKPPFPREWMSESSFRARPSKISSMGIIEVIVDPAAKAAAPSVSLRFDDSVQTRRSLIEGMIHAMMDSQASPADRAEAIAWSRPLEEALINIQAEPAAQDPSGR